MSPDSLWKRLTVPQATDPDDARREYMTKIVLVMIVASLIVVTPVIVAGWAFRAFTFSSVIQILLLDVPAAAAGWLAWRGRWRQAAYLLPVVFLLHAAYLTYTTGLETFPVFYVLAILLTGILHRIREQWYVVAISIGTYALMGWLHGDRAADLLAVNITYISGFLVGITLLQSLFLSQLHTALAQARGYAAELDAHQNHLEELVQERYEALQRANQELQNEIGQRRLAEDALNQARAGLEVRVQERTAELEESNQRLLHEIDERQRAEQALRESEALLHSLVESLPQNVYTKDLAGRFTFVNQQYCETAARSAQEILGKTDFDLHPRALADKYRADDRQVIETRQVYETVEEHKPLDQEGFYVQVIKTPLYDAQGQVSGTLGIFWDITERKRAEEALTHERDLLHALMDNIPDTIYFKDTAGRFTRINKAQAQLLGIDDPAEAIGRTDFDFLVGEHPQQAYQDEQDIVRSGKPIIDKVEKVQERGGSYRWVSATKVPIVDQEKKVIGIVGISRDIGERRQAEQVLRRSLAELQNLQHVTDALLSLEELSLVMNTVAQGIVSNLGFDVVLVSRYAEEEKAFTGLALHPIPRPARFDHMLEIMDRMDLKTDPTRYRLPYRRGENSLIDRVLEGETVTGHSLANFFEPWVPSLASQAVQRLVGLKSFVDVPMQVKGKTVGTIMAGLRNIEIAEEQIQALARVAGQAAVAIENARLFEAERQRSSELARSNAFLSALSQVAARIETTPDIGQILETLGAELKRLGISFFLALLDAQGQALVEHYTSLDPVLVARAEKLSGLSLDGLRMFPQSWPVKEVIQEGQASFVHDLIPVTASLVPQLAPHLVELGLRAAGISGDMKAIFLPLKVEEHVLGILAVWGSNLRQEDVAAFSVFAHQVAVALENARLLQDLAGSLEELQKTQNQLIQAQKMEAIGRLAGGVAHDFNNLLTIVELSTRLMGQQLHPRDPLWDHLRQIQEASERGTRLTRQLLRVSRQEAVEPQVLDLSQVVSEMGRLLQRIIGEDIELDMELADDLWPVAAAPSQMEQVVINLAINARDAMPNGGHLSIQTANKVLDRPTGELSSAVGPGEFVMVSISDTGTGMDQEVQAHVFEPFFTTKGQGQGTGLGLSTVYGIVRQNDGTIELESEVGQGTTFRIYLPRTQVREPKADALPALSLPPTEGSKTILVVEDEPSVRRLTRQILEEQGYQVLIAGNGVEALRVSQAHGQPIHLLLTDVVMPEMNGRELVEHLQPLQPAMRVLYMSGYSDDVIAHHDIPNGGTSFLTKPFSVETLIQKVRASLH